MIIFTVLVFVGYPLVFETATRGRTIGKMVMGLRVVSDDGGPERFRQALFRALASLVEIWMLVGSPAVICSMLSPRAKRIGDIFAGTSGDQRTRAEVGSTAPHAAAAGVVGRIAAAVRSGRRAGRGRAPIPRASNATRPADARPDGLSDRQRRAEPGGSATAAWVPAPARSGRGARRTAPQRIGPVTGPTRQRRWCSLVRLSAPLALTARPWSRRGWRCRRSAAPTPVTGNRETPIVTPAATAVSGASPQFSHSRRRSAASGGVRFGRRCVAALAGMI